MAEDLLAPDRHPPLAPRFEPQLLWSDPWLLALAKPCGLLDRDTSGLILLARDAHGHRLLSAAFAERRARIATRPPRYGVVPVALGGKPALSRWRRLDRLVQRRGHGWCQLVLQPHTGRSHQLRVHLAWLGHPLLGDPLYGDPRADGLLQVQRLQLHAAALRLRHPITGQPLRLRCAGNWGDL